MPKFSQFGPAMSGHGEPSEFYVLPAVHALHGAELAREWGASPEQIYAELGLDRDALAIPGAQLPVATFVRVVERARAITHQPALGVYLGLRMRAPVHGYVGFAAMTAATLRDAIEIATRFAPTRTNALGLRLHVNDGTAALVIEELADFGPARDAILLALAVGLWQIGIALTGRELVGTVDFAFPRPAYADHFGLLGQWARFDQPANQLVFDSKLLELPLANADSGSLQLAYEQCERSLEKLGIEGRVLERVRQLVLRAEGGLRSLKEVANEIHVSPRTLKRRLAAHGVTYSEVLDEQRREKSLLLLRSPKLSLDEVAVKLGYSDTANFSRAFRRWTGLPPGAYRRSQARGGG